MTRIEACEKPGEYCHLPYIRVWKGDFCFAEFGQHKIVGVYFEQTAIEAPPPDWAKSSGMPADHTDGPGCTCTECIPF